METLQTDRLIIRPFSMDDLESAHQVLDVEMQWSGPDGSLEQRRQELQRDILLSTWNDGSRLFGFRGICLQAKEQLIGLCGFHPWLWTPSQKALFWPQLFDAPGAPHAYAYASFELSIGYGLSSSHRKQGYATEAANALIRYAFETLHVKRIFADTTRSNVGSINVMKRVNMRVARHPTRPDEEWPDGPAVVGCIENSHRT